MKPSTVVLIVALVAALPAALVYGLADAIYPSQAVPIGILGFLWIFAYLLDRISETKTPR